MIQRLSARYPVSTICDLLEVPRTSYYNWLMSLEPKQDKQDQEADLVAAIERICLKYSRYGYRRVSRQLRREGFRINGKRVNRKKVLRLMRENKLLCAVKRSFVATTNSDHLLKKYDNILLKESIEPVSLNQVWVSDISYVSLEDGSFVYVAVVIDAYSRAVIGHSVSDKIDKHLVLEALKMALKSRRIVDAKQTLIHHSDQGVQYACKDYTDLLTFHGIRISMSRKGSPWENGIAESFFKTLKTEEVYINEYKNLREVKKQVFKFIDQVYNTDRLHSSIGYLPPTEFEQQHLLTFVKLAE